MRRIFFFPNDGSDKIITPKNFVGKNFQVMTFVVVNRNPNGAVIGKKLAGEFKAILHECKPSAVIEAVVVAEAVGAGIEWRVDINAFDLSGESFFDRGEHE